MSDVLIADSAVIEGPVQSWRDLRIAPNAAVIETGGSLALAWEIYDLAPDSTGQARWRVSVSRESGRTVIHDDVRSIIVGALGAGVQVVANEPGANMISYARADAASKTIIETLRFQWPTVSPGRHVLIVRIEDTVSGRTAQRAVNVLVRDPKSAR